MRIGPILLDGKINYSYTLYNVHFNNLLLVARIVFDLRVYSDLNIHLSPRGFVRTGGGPFKHELKGHKILTEQS